MKKTLVIHPYDPTTEFLSDIYQGMDVTLVREPAHISKNKMRDLILSHHRTIGLGHGSPAGLYALSYDEIMDGYDDYALNGIYHDILTHQTENIYLWSNADQWVARSATPIYGLFSGMFISETMEAELFGIKSSQKEIKESNAAFADLLHSGLRRGMNKLELYNYIVHNYEALNTQVARFNMKRLYLR